MIPLPFLERAARLMQDDEAVTVMLGGLIKAAKNPLLHGDGVKLDPRIFNARTFERIAARAKLMGDGELGDFMEAFALGRRQLDREQELVNAAVKAGRVISFQAASELFRALGLESDDEIRDLRIKNHRLSPLLGQPAFALIHDRDSLVAVPT